MFQGKRLLRGILLLSVSATLFTACRKENGIDNNSVVRTPYSMYYGDFGGALYNTTNGDSINPVFPPDGFAIRSVLATKCGILMIKKNVHFSGDEGRNFNPIDTLVHRDLPWQSLMLDVPSHGRIYLCIRTINGSITGLAFSEDCGRTFVKDTAFDAPIFGNTRFHSLAQLKNGKLFGWNVEDHKLYRRDSKNEKFFEVVTTGLPPAPFFISRFNNTLVATDTSGAQGALFSNDEGLNWSPYAGLPASGLNSTVGAFDQVLLTGTDSFGVYRLTAGNTFQPSNNGLALNTRVYAIAAKENIYKNDVSIRVIFLATDKGLYRSFDAGQNWTLAIPGSFRAVN